jgi:hypothetical protein
MPDFMVERLSLISRLGTRSEDALRAARAEANRALTNNRLTVSFDPSRNMWPGHYSGLVADRNGVFHALWLDRRSGTQQMYTTRITVGGTAPDRTDVAEVDVTDRVEVLAGTPAYDATKSTVRVPIQVRNVSKAPIFGPITLRIVTTGASAVFLTGKASAAEIRFARLGTDDVLPPLEVSEPVEITVKANVATGLDAAFDFPIVGGVKK